jgi:hypothetical protein
MEPRALWHSVKRAERLTMRIGRIKIQNGDV